jgi:hypothetical protein
MIVELVRHCGVSWALNNASDKMKNWQQNETQNINSSKQMASANTLRDMNGVNAHL